MSALWLRIRGWLAILRRRWLLVLIAMALIGVVRLWDDAALVEIEGTAAIS